MSLNQLQPFAGSHAIQHAVFVVGWQPNGQPRMNADGSPAGLPKVDIDAWMRVMRAAGFENIGLVHVQQIAVASAKAMPSANSFLAGLGGELRDGAEVIGRGQLTFGESLIVQFDRYTGWANVSQHMRKVCAQLVAQSFEPQAVFRVSLQYVDSFTWNGPRSELPYRQIFRQPNRWLVEHAHDCHDFWHSHHGWFNSGTAPAAYKQLNQVNVSLTPVSGRDCIMIHTLGQCDFQDSGLWIRHEGELQRLLDVWDRQHTENKVILGELLSDSLVQRISLFGQASQNHHAS